MGKYTSKLTALALAGLLLPSLAWAAGLGKLTVFSALGQPLRAEIEVTSVQSEEVGSLTARLASADAHREANIDRQAAANAIRFIVDRRSNGQHVVLMTTVEPMNEPFLDVLVELNWANGRFVREYTFLLDPVEYKPPVAPEPAVVAPPAAQPMPAPEAKEPAARAPAVTERALAPAEAKPAAAGKPTAAYEVKRGDTLTKIANEHKVEGVSLQQMLVALYRGNQDAFIGGNMNRLRAGKILNIPERDAAADVSLREAVRTITEHNAGYAEYRRQIGAAVAQAPEGAGARRQVTGRIGAPSEAAPPAPKEAAKDQLRLSKAEDAKSAGRAGAAARADDLAAKDKALKEANERVAMLEKNVQELQKLAQLKSETGAQMQQAAKGAPAKAAPGPAAKAAPEPAKAAPPAPKAAEPAKAAPAPEAAKAAGPAAPAAKAPEAAAPKAAPKASPKAAAPPPPEPSFIDELLENSAAIGSAIGVIILLAGYAAYKWRMKRKAQYESSLMATASQESPSVFGASGGQQVDTGGAAFQSDFSQGGIGKIDTEEIDPIAEADVYMAYGRDTQAEEILKEALGKDASRHEIRAKLLEVYANRKDLKAFETTATELYAATNGQGPEWEKALALGLSIDPTNPLYGGSPAAAEPAGDTQVLSPEQVRGAPAAQAAVEAPAQAAPPLDFDLDLGGEPEQAAAAAPSAATVTAPAEAATTLDFDLGLGDEQAAAPEKPAPGGTITAQAPKTEAAAPAADSDGGLSIDFDLGTPEAAQPAPAAAPAPEAAPAADMGLAMDFDLGEPGGEAKPAKETAKPAEEAPPALDLSAISFDLGDAPAAGAQAGAAAPDPHWQEVATKLDLAKAYQEMGDKDGARELLNEVANEGDAAQKQQAKTMLDALG